MKLNIAGLHPACMRERKIWGNNRYRYLTRFNPASPPPAGLLHPPCTRKSLSQRNRKTKHAFGEFFPSPGGRSAPFTGMIVARLQENADLVADENRAGDDSTSPLQKIIVSFLPRHCSR